MADDLQEAVSLSTVHDTVNFDGSIFSLEISAELRKYNRIFWPDKAGLLGYRRFSPLSRALAIKGEKP